MKNTFLFTFIVLFLAVSQVSAFNLMNLTQWKIEDGGNDHWYGVNITRNIWQESENEANSFAIDGFIGNLASITSQAENSFIFNTIAANIFDPLWSDQTQFLLGGNSNNGNWRWSTEEQFEYANWSFGEPNHDYETVLSMWGASSTDPDRIPGMWNNTTSSFGLYSIVEWGDVNSLPSAVPPVTAVPEPSTIILFSLALVGLGMKRSLGV